jgi:hypothetical protein
VYLLGGEARLETGQSKSLVPVTFNFARDDPDISTRGTVGRGLHSFTIELNRAQVEQLQDTFMA